MHLLVWWNFILIIDVPLPRVSSTDENGDSLHTAAPDLFIRRRKPLVNTLQRLADRLGRTSLWMVAFLPFLNPIHSSPIPSFYSEWMAAALGLLVICCCAATTRPAGKLQIPVITLLPLGLMAAVLIQLAFGHVSHPRYALLYCCFLLLASALMIVGRLDSNRLGLERLAGILATAFLAGALIQSILTVLQRAGLPIPWASLAAPSGTWSGGLLGQRNHLVDYLWLGVASVIYLSVKQKISATLGGALVFGLALTSVLHSSRSAFLYPVGLAAVSAFAWQRSGRLVAWRKVIIICLLTIPAMFAVDQWPRDRTASSATASERLTAAELDPVRSGLLQVAWLATMDRPLSGYGVGAAPAATFERAAIWPEKTRPVVAEHFHNVVAQWMVEFGLPLTLAATGFAVYWLSSAVRNAQLAEHWWILSLLAVVGLHSQLEYPLWLAYFLVPTALLAGALGPSLRVQLQFRSRHRLLAFAGLAATSFTMISLWLDYRQLEIVAAASGPGMGRGHLEQAIGTALALERNSLLAPQATVLLTGAMGVSREGAAAKWVLCREALRISPTRDVALKCPAIAAINGDHREAARLLHLGTIIYGNNPTWPALLTEFPELQGLESRP